MLVNSPMVDTGGGDATLKVVTASPAAVAVTTPKGVETDMSAMHCRNSYTEERGDTCNVSKAHTTSAKKQRIHDGGCIAAVMPSGDGHCICEIELNVPLAKRLKTNLTMSPENWAAKDLNSGFLLSDCSLSWTNSPVDTNVSPARTVDSGVSPESSIGNVVSSDIKVDRNVSSDHVVDNMLLSDSAFDMKVTSDRTVNTKVSSNSSSDNKVLLDSTFDIKVSSGKMSSDITVDSKVSSGITVDSKVSPDSTVDSKMSPENVTDINVSSCGRISHIGVAVHLSSVDTCRRQSPMSQKDIQPTRTQSLDYNAKQNLADGTGQNDTEVRIEENLADWDPETPIKHVRKKYRKRRDTGEFLMIHMNNQILEDFDTPDKRAACSDDAHIVRRSRRLWRKSMQLQQMLPSDDVDEERCDPSESAMKSDTATVGSLPAPPSSGSTCADSASHSYNEGGSFVTLRVSGWQEHETSDICTSDVMETERCGTTISCPVDAKRCLGRLPELSSDAGRLPPHQRSNRRRRSIQKVSVVKTNISLETSGKRQRKQKKGKNLEPVNLGDLYNEVPREDQQWTAIQEEGDTISREPESLSAVPAPHVTIKKCGQPRKNHRNTRRQSMPILGEIEALKVLLGNQQQTDELQDHSLSNANRFQTGQDKTENTIADVKEILADWDPETPLKQTPKNRRSRRDTRGFVETLAEFGTPDKSNDISPNDVIFKVRQPRRTRRKSMPLEAMPPDDKYNDCIGSSKNSAMTVDIATERRFSDDITYVVNAGQDRVSDTFVTLCSSSRQEPLPSDIVASEQPHSTNLYPSVAETSERIGVVAPNMSTDSVAALPGQRSVRRRKCAQRISVVEVDLSPESPKKKRKQKRSKKPEPVNLDDLYNNRLWRSQMPAEDQRWPTIPEEDDATHEEPESWGTAAAIRVTTSKLRVIKFTDFYSKVRLTRRRQKARRQGWKPPRRKLMEKENIAALLENKLQTLDEELREIND